MNWLTTRQNLLAQNVANVDTPQYKAVDLRPLDFRSELAQAQGRQPQLQLASTSPSHLSSLVNDTSDDGVTRKEVFERDINGNTVSVEDEMMKVTETTSDYQLITSLYKKQIGLLKQAIGKGTGS